MASDIFKGFQELVEQQGDEVGLDSPTCVIWKADHDNCKGCPAELGCAKAVAMMGISLTPLMYTPKDYDDYNRMHRDIGDKLDRVLKAKTSEEIHSII